MSEEIEITSANQLLEQEPEQVQSWLAEYWGGKRRVPSTFNWHGLAEGAGFRARHEDNLKWAVVSISVYDRLQRANPAAHFDLSSMNVRAFFIVKRVAVPGDPVLDLEVILNWFWESLPMSLADAAFGIPKCKETLASFSPPSGPESLQICRELRQVKNRLNIIEFLVEGGALVPDVNLRSWLELSDSLP